MPPSSLLPVVLLGLDCQPAIGMPFFHDVGVVPFQYEFIVLIVDRGVELHQPRGAPWDKFLDGQVGMERIANEYRFNKSR